MGLNISVYRVGKKIPYEFSHGYFYDADPYPDWDTVRYSGDSEFATEVAFDSICDDGEIFEHAYHRPTDFEGAEQWVKDNVTSEGNQERLLTILATMREQTDLWFKFSW